VGIAADEHGAPPVSPESVDDAVADHADAYAERLDGSALSRAALGFDGTAMRLVPPCACR